MFHTDLSSDSFEQYFKTHGDINCIHFLNNVNAFSGKFQKYLKKKYHTIIFQLLKRAIQKTALHQGEKTFLKK